MSEDFIKNDAGKLQWSLVPFKEMEEVVKVLMNGAAKYSPGNWQKCDDPARYKDALMRHVIQYLEGDKKDIGEGGDGLSHLAHAICNCLFLMWFDNKSEVEFTEEVDWLRRHNLRKVENEGNVMLTATCEDNRTAEVKDEYPEPKKAIKSKYKVVEAE